MTVRRSGVWGLLALIGWEMLAAPIAISLPAVTAQAANTPAVTACSLDASFCAAGMIGLGRSESELVKQDPATIAGQLLDVALSPQVLRMDGYDHQQLIALKNAWPALLTASATYPGLLNRYDETVRIPDGTEKIKNKDGKLVTEPNILKQLGLTKQPAIDVRVIETLNYLTRPSELNNGAGITWLDVSSINNAHRNDALSKSPEYPAGSEQAKSTSPLSKGKGFRVDQIGQLLGTRFTYQVNVPADTAKDQQQTGALDPSKIDWSQATIVGKQKLPPVPINVGWQTTAGVPGQGGTELLNQTINDLTKLAGGTTLGQYLAENGASCTPSGPPDLATIGSYLTQSFGLACLQRELGTTMNLLRGKDPFDRAYQDGQDQLGNMLGIPGRGVDPQHLFTTAGLAQIEVAANLPPGSLVHNAAQLTSRESVLDAVGQGHINSQLDGWTGRNEFAYLPPNDPAAVKRAVGLSFLEARLQRTIDDFAGSDLKTFAQQNPLVYQLMVKPASQQAADTTPELMPSIIGINPILYAKLLDETISPSNFLEQVGEQVIQTKRDRFPSALDAGLGLGIGKADGAGPNERFDAFTRGDPAAWKPIGSSLVVSKVASEPTMQNDLYRWLDTGVTPTDATGLPTVDLGYVNGRLPALQSGDFKAIFFDGQGLAVANRLGNFSYYQSFSGQAQNLADSVKPIISGQVFVDYATNVKNQAQNVVNILKEDLRTAPNQILGSITSNLQAQLNAMNQDVYNQINARMQADGSANAMQQITAPLDALYSQIASATQYGPPEIRQTFAGPLQDWANARNTMSVPNLTNPIQWTGGAGAGTSVVTDTAWLESVKAAAAGKTGVSAENPLGMAGNVLATGLGHQAAVVGQNAQQLVRSTNQALINAYGLARALDPSNWKVTIDSKGIYNFVMYDLVPIAGVQDFSAAISAGLKAANGQSLTDAEVRGLITNTSLAAAARLGADQADVAFGLTAGAPFINVMLGQDTLDHALATSAYQTALQYSYGFTGGFSKDPTVNSAIGIVLQEGLGWAGDEITSMNDVIETNGPDGVLSSLGLLDQPLTDRPGQPTLRQLSRIDPEEYTRQAGKVYQRISTNPTESDRAAMTSYLEKSGLPANPIIDFVTGKITTGEELVAQVALPGGPDSNLVFNVSSPESFAQSYALQRSGSADDASYDENYKDGLALAGKIGMQPDGTLDPSKADNAGAQALAGSIVTRQIGDSLGDAKDVLDPHLQRMQSRLIDLGISSLDQQIYAMTGVSGVMRTFYLTKDPTEAAVRLGWQALTKYVNMPPELVTVLNYFGGDPISIAKTFSEGRTGAALGAYGAAQMYQLTHDAGISLALHDVLVAQLGPSVAEKKQLNAQADAHLQRVNQTITDTITNDPEISPDKKAAALAAALEQVPDKKTITDAQVKRTRDVAAKNMQDATLDYAATMALRTASGNQSVSLGGLTKIMTDPTAKPGDQASFVIRALSPLTPPELAQYLQDATAAYDIYTFIHETDLAKRIEVVDVGGDTGLGNDFGPTTVRVNVTDGGPIKVPNAAFNYVDSRLSQVLGWQLPPGFTKGMVSLIANGFDPSKSLTLPSGVTFPSMNTVLVGGAIAYAGVWLDKLTGLPPGTSYGLYQVGIQLSQASQQLARAQLVYDVVSLTQPVASSASAAAGETTGAGLSTATATTIGAQVEALKAAGANATYNVVSVNGNAGAVPTASDLLNTPTIDGGETANAILATTPTLEQAQFALSAGARNFATVATVAVNLVVNLALGKTFAKLDQSIGLPAGTTSTLISAGVAIGISAAVTYFGATAAGAAFVFGGAQILAALGGPVGIALMAVGLLVSALGLFSGGNKKKKPNVAETISRVFYSASGVYPGFENEATFKGKIITPALTADAPVIIAPGNSKIPLPVANQPVQAMAGKSGPLTVLPISGTKPLSVTATFPAAANQTIIWGDGKSETVADTATSATHSYDAVNSFTVSLQFAGTTQTTTVGSAVVTVTPDAGNVPETTKPATDATPQSKLKPIPNPDYPTMTLGALALAPQPDALAVATTEADPLVAIATFGTIKTGNITWGDGTTDTLSESATAARHTYGKAGDYTVSLKATTEAKREEITGTATVAAGTPPTTSEAASTPTAGDELASEQKFRTGDALGFPYSPAPFEANTAQEFSARIASVAQFNVTTFLGSVLYMTKRLGVDEDVTNPATLRPKRIKSYDDGNFYLASLILPRYRDQIDAIYPNFLDSVHANQFSGKPKSDFPKQGIEGLPTIPHYVQVSW